MPPNLSTTASVVKRCPPPRWLARRIRIVVKVLGVKPKPACMLLHQFVPYAQYGLQWEAPFLDHHGTTVVDGRPCYVVEPYASPETTYVAARFAAILGLRWEQAPEAYWNPPRCTRFLFWVDMTVEHPHSADHWWWPKIEFVGVPSPPTQVQKPSSKPLRRIQY